MSVNIMCVDNSASIFASLKCLLADVSFSVYAYDDPMEALLAMETIEFAVVVVDQSLQRMDGLAFLKKVKNRSPVTAGVLIADRLKLEKGAEAIDQGYLFRLIKKPCEPAKIRNAVKSGVAHYEMMVDQKHG